MCRFGALNEIERFCTILRETHPDFKKIDSIWYQFHQNGHDFFVKIYNSCEMNSFNSLKLTLFERF